MLRKQALFNHVLSSCLRNLASDNKHGEETLDDVRQSKFGCESLVLVAKFSRGIVVLLKSILKTYVN